MSVTVTVEALVKLTTTVQTDQILQESEQAMTVGEYNDVLVDLESAAIHSFTGGEQMTVITTDLSTGSTITIQFGGNSYTTLGSVLVLPGGVGAVVITNTTSSTVALKLFVVDE